MKLAYIIKLSATKIAIADLASPGDVFPGWTITRINVPWEYRGQGYGTKILNMILEEADQEGVDLYLVASSSGSMDDDELEAWYRRHGFHHDGRHSYYMRRRPYGRVPSFEERFSDHKVFCDQ